MNSSMMGPSWTSVMLLVMVVGAVLLLGGFYVISRINDRDAAKRKREDLKPKRDHEEETAYTIGDDGELVEIDSSVDPFEDDETGEEQAHSIRH